MRLSSVCLLALAVATGFVTSQALSQGKDTPKEGAKEKKKKEKGSSEKGQPGDAPAPSEDQQKMMEAMMRYGTPGTEHKLLERKVGKWNHAVKMWMDPSAAPGESAGTTEYTMIMQGRYLQDRTKSKGLGEGAFEGMGLTGYDNFKKKYVSIWIDNMATGIMYSEGTGDKQGKVFTFTSEQPDFKTGKMQKTRMV